MNNSNNNFLLSKKNIKWFESRIENFNNVVPYQINVLTSHRKNILNQYRLGNYIALKQERTSAQRIIRYLENLLIEIDGLREQVKDADLNKFDKATSHSRESINEALKNFNDLYKSLEIPKEVTEKHRSPNYYDDDDNITADEGKFGNKVLIHVPEDVWDQNQQKEIEDSVKTIQNDVVTVNQIFRDLAVIVNDQKPQVEMLEDNIGNTHACVVAAEKELAQAATKIHNAAYPLVGAILGSCVGGPVGLVAGLKIGTAVALTCSVIGFSGGKVLKVKQQRIQEQILDNNHETPTVKS